MTNDGFGTLSQCLEAALRGDREAQRELVRRNRSAVRRPPDGCLVAPDDLIQIVRRAIGRRRKDSWADACGRLLSIGQRSCRSRESRPGFRQALANEGLVGQGPTRSSEGLLTARNIGRLIAEVLLRELAATYALLEARERDLLSTHYGLEAFFPPVSDPREELDPQRYPEACAQARERLGRLVEHGLRARLEHASDLEVLALSLALEIVRGECYVEYLNVLGELDRVARS